MHEGELAEAAHVMSETLLLPTRWFVQAITRFKQPAPGQDKESVWWNRGVKVVSGFTAVGMAMQALVSLVVGLPLRWIEHGWRPFMGVLNAAPEGFRPATVRLTPEEPLHVRSANLCLVPKHVASGVDVRDPVERAQQIAQSWVSDPNRPKIVFLQEGWNEDAVKALHEGAKEVYPFGILNVAPQIVGMNASVGVLSQLPIEEVVFERYRNMVAPHSIPPRGILRVRIQTDRGPVLFYNSHTQSMRSEEYARARLSQLQQLNEMVARDAQSEPNVLQCIVGDLNTPTHLEDGRPVHAEEQRVQTYLHQRFQDLFLQDHDAQGVRTQGMPRWLNTDNGRMGLELEEPRASWYNGPMDLYPAAGWGTRAWFGRQPALTTRYDYVAVPNGNRLTGRVEMRRYVVPRGTQSAPSDHLQVDAELWVN
jgi:endonuclease/exonuclease/phosphatase family metal-dependent hydrolase